MTLQVSKRLREQQPIHDYTITDIEEDPKYGTRHRGASFRANLCNGEVTLISERPSNVDRLRFNVTEIPAMQELLRTIQEDYDAGKFRNS